MTKTYRLTYESVEVMHALFDKTSATQGWKISSRVLREYVEYFAPKAEQLDLYADNGKAVFTSFTEKVDDGKCEYPTCVVLVYSIDAVRQSFSSNRLRLPLAYIPQISTISICKKASIS